MEVLGHNCDSASMDGAEISVFEKSNKVSFSSFLKSEDGLRLEADIVFHFHSDISDKSLEGKLSDE